MQESHRIILIHDEMDHVMAQSFECALRKHHIAVRGHSAAMDDIDHGEHGQSRFAVLMLTKNAWFSSQALHEVSLAKMKLDKVIVVDFCREQGLVPSEQARRIYLDAVQLISTRGKSMDSVATEIHQQIKQLSGPSEVARGDFDIPRSSFMLLGGAVAVTLLFIAIVVHYLSPAPFTKRSRLPLKKQDTTELFASAEKPAGRQSDPVRQREEADRKEAIRQEKAKKVIAAAIKHVNRTQPGGKSAQSLNGISAEKLIERLPDSNNDQEAINSILDIVDKAGADGGDVVLELKDHPYAKIAEAFKNQKFKTSQSAPAMMREQLAAASPEAQQGTDADSDKLEQTAATPAKEQRNQQPALPPQIHEVAQLEELNQAGTSQENDISKRSVQERATKSAQENGQGHSTKDQALAPESATKMHAHHSESETAATSQLAPESHATDKTVNTHFSEQTSQKPSQSEPGSYQSLDQVHRARQTESKESGQIRPIHAIEKSANISEDSSQSGSDQDNSIRDIGDRDIRDRDIRDRHNKSRQNTGNWFKNHQDGDHPFLNPILQ